MKYSFFGRIRDIVFLCLLISLIKTAYDRSSTFLRMHKNSIIHELDRNFMDELYTAQRQAHALEQNPIYAETFGTALSDIKNRLATIEEKYKKNSPGLAFLGPIGSVAIVAKEEKLQKQLLETINDLSKIFHTISQHETTFVPAETITIGLHNNKQFLRALMA